MVIWSVMGAGNLGTLKSLFVLFQINLPCLGHALILPLEILIWRIMSKKVFAQQQDDRELRITEQPIVPLLV